MPYSVSFDNDVYSVMLKCIWKTVHKNTHFLCRTANSTLSAYIRHICVVLLLLLLVNFILLNERCVREKFRTELLIIESEFFLKWVNYTPDQK